MTAGPIHGLRFIHAAIRAQAADIVARSQSIDSPADARQLLAAAQFLAEATSGHARGEDVGYFPTLAERAGGVVEPFGTDHVEENARLDRFVAAVEGCSSDEDLANVRELASALRDSLHEHMVREETVLWPLTEQHFSPPEQGAIIGAIIGAVPRESMPRLIPWMVEWQSADEAVAYVKMLKHVQPPEVFRVTVGWIREGVSPARWKDVAAGMPELA